ncbi:MAG: Smr/MutS family protein [Desulfobacterales bacterium]|jgi:dsDNA-specific endonuclease/ATPase MutS2
MAPVDIPIEDVLDLHTFRPSDLTALIEDYLDACRQKGFDSVRIIHGKGRGVMRRRLHSILHGHPHVVSFGLAPPDAGGWGATVAELKRDALVPKDSDLKCRTPDGSSRR